MEKIEDLPRDSSYIEEEDEDSEEEEDDDEDEDEDEDEVRVSFSYDQLNSLLIERGGTGLSHSLVNDEFIYTQTNLECLFLGNGARPLCDWEWDDRIEESPTLTIVTQQAEDNTWQTTVIQRMIWHLMDNGQWQANVTNPEEDTGIVAFASDVHKTTRAAAEKIQALWRGFVVRSRNAL